MSAPKRLRLTVVGLEHGAARSFQVERDGRLLDGFVLRHGDSFFAYVNRCPHWGVDLDLGDGRFFAEDIDRIYCKNHGATFMPDTGICDSGPCVGRSLERFETTLEGSDLLITLTDARALPEE